MKSSNNKSGVHDVPFLPAGPGLHVMRTCGKCGRRSSPTGGTVRNVYGWVGPCCPKKEKVPA